MIEIKLNENQANDVFANILSKLEVQDIDKICPSANAKDDGLEDLVKRAIRCGLVSWDDNENCLVQKLINKIDIGGGVEAEALKYNNGFVTLGMQDKLQSGDVVGIVSDLTGRPGVLIGKMRGQDSIIASALVKCFFGK